MATQALALNAEALCADLYEQVSAIEIDVAECQEPFQMLESVEPGCRAY